MPVKVMHVRASNFFGGPEKQIIEHLRLLKGTEIQPLLVSFYEKGRETDLALRAGALGITRFSLPCFSAYDPMQPVRLRTLLRSEKPELICTHDYRSTFLSSIARTSLPVRQIAFWRGITRENPKVALYYIIERRLLSKMDHVVVVSKEQQSFLISHGLSSAQVSLVPNAVRVKRNNEAPGYGLSARGPDLPSTGESGLTGRAVLGPGAREVLGPGARGGEQAARLAELFKSLRNRKIIATAGRLSPEKGHKYLIEAMRYVLAGRNDVVLLIFGGGPLRGGLMRLAERLGCADSIHFLGFVPEFASFLDDIDLFVLSSLTEGLPNALLEAMAAAKPVIATSVGGVPEVVIDGKTGILVPSGDSMGLASAITKVLSDSALANSMGLAGQEAVRRSHSFEKQLELLSDVYARTLAKLPVTSSG